MRKLFLFSFWIFPRLVAAQAPSDTILWSDERVSWSAFTGNDDTVVYNRQYLATTFWRLNYQYKYIRAEKKLVFEAYAWIDAHRSWVRKNSRSNKALLAHEQGHFDLAELFSRQLKRTFSETSFSPNNYADSIRIIFGRLLAAANQTQVLYDDETRHGTHAVKQENWQRVIAAELKKLQHFSGKTIAVSVK